MLLKMRLTQENIYLFSNFLFNLGRVLPHAVLTIILLNKGLNLSEISLIQSMFMVAVLISEFPSGILADRFSVKIMYQLALIFIAISYLMVYLTSNFYLLCISWGIYGLSAASMSGTLDSYFVKLYRNDEDDIKPFVVKKNSSMMYSALFGGLFGSVLYNVINTNIYVVSIVFFIIALIQVTLGISVQIDEHSNEQVLSDFIKTAVLDLRNNRNLGLVVIQLVLFQVITQLYFQYWQVLFLDRSFDSTSFGVIYVVMQLVAILSNRFFSKLKYSLKSEAYMIIMMTLLFSSSIVTTKLPFLITIFLFQVPFNIYTNQLNLDVQRLVSKDKISSSVSLVGTLCMVSSIVILWIFAVLLKFFSIDSLILATIVFFFVTSIIVLKFKSKNY
ncbi:MFS transporter [Enterococcus sp. DIV0876]|uniref:MFS transporter n=1 Tax=Enterococcus sp. DIV0876 TaxID=2774633 RepID=UPI003D2FBA8A